MIEATNTITADDTEIIIKTDSRLAMDFDSFAGSLSKEEALRHLLWCANVNGYTPARMHKAEPLNPCTASTSTCFDCE